MSPLFKALLGHSIVAVVGGGIGGVAVWSVMSAGPQPKITRELSAATRDGASDRADRNGSGAEGSSLAVRRLEQRLGTLERRNSAQQAMAQYVGRMDADAGGNDPTLQAMLASKNPVLESAVRGVLERVEAEKREERATEQQNRQMERATNAALVLEQKLKLDGNQKAQVEQAFLTAMESLQKFRQSMQNGGPPGAVGPEARDGRDDWRGATTEIRKHFDKELAGVFREDQRKSFAELKKTDPEIREVTRMFGGGGGRGGDRGPR